MSSLDYLDLCRLCLVKDQVSVPIFDGEGDVRQIFLKIAACLPVKLTRDDKLPKKICNDCVYKVELFYEFWNTTSNSEKQLMQWLGEVDVNDKQTYVTAVINQDQSSDNRLDGNVMQQTNEHQNNMGMNIIETMSLEMPMMMSTDQTQMTINTTNNSNSQSIQALPGTSAQQKDGMGESEEDNSDDDMDRDEGLPVKEEIIQDTNRIIEPGAFLNVSLPCDEPGPSGLQQQKNADIPDMVIGGQTTESDNKAGRCIRRKEVGADDSRGLFIFDQSSVIMKKWQILEFDGMPYYAFVPENDKPIDPTVIPSEDDDETEEYNIASKPKIESMSDETLDNDESFYDYDYIENDFDNEASDETQDIKPILLDRFDDNNETKSQSGELYQVKVEGDLLTLEKVDDKINERETESILPEFENKKQKCEFIEEENQYTSLDTDYNDESNDEETTAEPDEDDNDDDVDDENDNDEIDNINDYYDNEEQSQEVPQYNEPEMLEYVSVEEQENEEDVDDVDSVFKKNKNIISLETNQQKRTRYRPILPSPLKGLKCKLCSEIFSSQIAFRKHVAWSHMRKVCIQEDGAYICSVCDFKTSKKSLFIAHIERKHETSGRRGQNPEFPCQICGFICRSKHSLQSHHTRKHTDSFEHQCKFCDKKFKVKGDLTNHIRFHHKEKPVKCDLCDRTCQNSGSLYVHKKWSHHKPKYECSICKRRMVTQENLDKHMISQHEKREKISCETCGKTFTKKDSYKRHMAVHTGSKPHSCPVCSKMFARQSQLRQHVLIHTGIRKFVCDICGKAFTQKPGLICHRKTHPGLHPPLPVMPIADMVKKFIDTAALNKNKIDDNEQDIEIEIQDEQEEELEDEAVE